MSYRTLAMLARDENIRARIVACAATQGIAEPVHFIHNRNWKFAAQPGWDAAYASALANNVANPGNNESVISDAMILSAVQAVIAAEAPAPEPTP